MTNLGTKLAEERELAKASAELAALERKLQVMSVLSTLYDSRPEELSASMIHLAKELELEENEDDDDDSSIIRIAAKRKAPTNPSPPIAGKQIIFGKHRSRIDYNGVTKITSEAEDDDELNWISKSPRTRPLAKPLEAIRNRNVVHARGDASSKVNAAEKRGIIKSVKETILKNKKEKDMKNIVAENLLRRKAGLEPLKEDLTPAMRTIKSHYTPPKNVPTEFNSVAERAADTQSRIPDFFKSTITPSTDNSFVAQMKRTKAAETLNRPRPEFENSETNAQGEVADKYWPHPVAATTTNSAKISREKDQMAKTRAPEHSVDLKNPKRGQDYFGGKTDGIGV